MRQLILAAFLMTVPLAASYGASAPTPKPALANNVQDDMRMNDSPFAEERKAAQNFIESVNEARKELALKETTLALQKIIMARNLLPLINRVKPSQRRLTRVEFGGGLYADDLHQRMSYYPIQTESLENLTRNGGPRWVKNTRSESDAKIIYVSLDLTDDKAKTNLDRAEKDIGAGNIKDAEDRLAELSDTVIRIDDSVPAAVEARDYIILADNFIRAGNFYGARNSLQNANDCLDKMRDDDIYKSHRPDIITLHKSIENLQAAFAKLDADQIKSAETNLKKWQEQLAGWAGE